jgi:hypothetical protein
MRWRQRTYDEIAASHTDVAAPAAVDERQPAGS